MTDAVPGYADEILNEGDPVFNPAGATFAAWLNGILGKGAATHWTTLTEDLIATVNNHGRAFDLDDNDLYLDPAASLEAGYRICARGPGSIFPESGEGDSVTLGEGDFALIGSDGSAIYIMTTRRSVVAIPIFVSSRPQANELVFRMEFVDTTVFPDGLTTSRGSAGTGATGEAVFSFKKNDVEFGTATFDGSVSPGESDSASFDSDSTVFVAGDVLTVRAPSSADATLADISLTIRGYRP